MKLSFALIEPMLGVATFACAAAVFVAEILDVPERDLGLHAARTAQLAP